MSDFRRRRKLIKPGLQLRLVGVFVGLSALALLLQFVLFTNALHHAANSLPNDGGVLLEEANRITARVLFASFTVFLPLTFLIGVLTTFRIAGPLYRFEMFLEAVRRGEKPHDFRLRRKDELHDFAALLNDATAPLRQTDTAGASSSPPSAPEPPALAGKERHSLPASSNEV